MKKNINYLKLITWLLIVLFAFVIWAFLWDVFRFYLLQ